MFWAGAWRPVTYMRDREGRETFSPWLAAAAVLFIDEDVWQATTVSPGDIVRRDGRPATPRDWDVV
jgi:hypothetical protein